VPPGHSLSIPKEEIIPLKKSKISISNTLITLIFKKSYFLKVLKNAPECPAPGALVNISHY